jgi:hypothetical protein
MVDLRRIVFPTCRFLLRWESRRRLGVVLFVAIYGAMGFGLTMYVCISVLFYVVGYGAIPLVPRSGGGPILGFLLFPVLGVGSICLDRHGNSVCIASSKTDSVLTLCGTDGPLAPLRVPASCWPAVHNDVRAKNSIATRFNGRSVGKCISAHA